MMDRVNSQALKIKAYLPPLYFRLRRKFFEIRRLIVQNFAIVQANEIRETRLCIYRNKSEEIDLGILEP